MAENDHVIGILVNLRDRASSGLKNIENGVKDVTDTLKGLDAAQKQQNKTARETTAIQKEMDEAFGDSKRTLSDYQRELNITEGQLKRIASEEKKLLAQREKASGTDRVRIEEQLTGKLKERAFFTDRLIQIEEKYNKTQKESITQQIRGRNAAERLGISIYTLRERYRDLTFRVKESTRVAEDNDQMWGKLRRTWRESRDESTKLERKLALLGRAMLGLAIASVIIFFQSLASMFVAVGAQAVALAGSLSFAAGALGGTFVAAIAQALPMLGLLAAAMQRISLVNDALSAQEAFKKSQQGGTAEDENAAIDRANQIADAQRGVVDAQRELTEARAEARRELQDLILAEREAELAMRGALLTQQQARQGLRDAVQSGDVGGLAGSRLGVAESRLGTRSARIDLRRARADAGEARAGGVENMDRVLQATRQLDDANRQLADAHRQAAAGAEAQSAQVDNLAFALKQLSPAERKLYEMLLRLKERVEKEIRPITDILINAFAEGLGQIEKVLFDNKILNGLTKLAEGMADSFGRLIDVVTSERSMRFWTEVLGDAEKNLKPLTEIVADLYRLFMNIAEGAAPVLHRLLKLIADEVERWVEATGDRRGMEEFFQTGLKHLRAWWGLFKSIVELAAALFGASQRSALKSIESMTERVQDATDYIHEHGKEVRQFFEDTGVAFEYLIDIVAALGKELIKSFSPEAVRAFRDIFVDVLIPAIGEAIRIMGQFVILFDNILKGTGLGQLLAIALTFKIVAGSVGLLVALIRPLVGLLFSIIDKLVLFGEVVGIRGAALLRFAGVIGLVISALIIFRDEVAELFSILWDRIGPPLEELFQEIKDFVGFFSGAGEDLDGFRGAIQDIAGALKKLIDILAGGVFDTLKGVFSGIGRVIGGVVKMLTGFLKILQGDFSGIGDILEGALDVALGTLEQFVAPFKAAGEAIANIFVAAFEGLGGTLANIFEKVFDGLLGGLTSLLDGVVGAMRAVPDFVSPPGFQSLADSLDTMGDDIDSFREGLRDEEAATRDADDATRKFNRTQTELGVTTRKVTRETKDHTDAVSGAEKETRKFERTETELGQTTKDTRQETEKEERAIESSKKEKEKARKETRSFSRALGGLIDTFFGTGKQSSELGRVVKEVTNSVLKSFGVKELKLSVPTAKQVGKVAGSVAGFFGDLFASGGMIGNPWERGPDDRVIGVAGGEAVLTGHHQRVADMGLAYGKAAGIIPYGSLDEMFSKDKREHRTSGYARGGRVPSGGFPDADGALPGLDALAWFLEKKFGLGLVDGRRPAGTQTSTGGISDHTWGGAIDVSNGSNPTPQMDAANAFLRKTLGGGGDFVSNYSGGMIKQMLYRTNLGGNHFNHIHVALQEAAARNAEAVIAALGGGGIGGIGGQLKRIKIKGPEGPLKDMLQGQADELRKQANKYINKKTMTLDLGGLGAGPHAGVLSESEVRKIFLAAFRVTGVSPGGGNLGDLMNLAFEESSWNPGVSNTTPAGIAAGGPQGILQVVGSTFAAARAEAQRQGLKVIPKDPFNALHNAIASIIYQMGRYGDIQRHAPYARGGRVPEFDQGGVVPGSGPKRAIVHGGETILPTHKFQSGGRADMRKSLRAIRRQVRGGKGGFQDALVELLREGGLFDDLAEAIDFFVAAQARRISEFSYRVRRGMAVQIRTHQRIANRELDALEDTGKILNKELNQIEKLMNRTKRKLKKADSSKERQELRTALNNLEKRAGEVGDVLAQNILDRIDAQNAVFDAAMSRFSQRIGISDLRQQILQAQNRLAGRPENQGVDALLGQTGRILERQQDRIQRELRRARSRGDTERARELEQALLENKLAILENTEAMKENTGTLGEIFGFNSSAWEKFRMAVFSGTGGMLPSYQMPNVPGVPLSSTLGANSGTIINITEPMEVADPIALSTRIAFEQKKYKV